MTFNLFLNRERHLRNIWWVAIFFLILAAITFPAILLSTSYGFQIMMFHQVIMVFATSWICQLIRKKPLSELTGVFILVWLKRVLQGLATGFALMIIPSLFLMASGFVTWQITTYGMWAIMLATWLFVAVAIAEEMLFRGFIFQRLVNGLGEWPAQLLIGALFLLTHMNNPGMTGSTKIFACINIFLASIMFGLAYIRTQSLAMPIGMDFMANWTQGVLLGFGVSGNEEASLLKPLFSNNADWITGGSFGLEASVPGLICVIISIILLYRWRPITSLNQLNLKHTG